MRPEFVEQAAVSDETAVTIEEERLEGAPPPRPLLEPPPERELWPWLLALLVLVLGGVAVAYFATRNDRSTQHQATTQTTVAPTHPTTSAREARLAVPRLVGVQTPIALRRLRQIRLSATTHNVFSDKPRNTVVAQTPPPSRKLAKGATVTLNVSKGPNTVAVSDVVGQTLADALSTLRANNFKARIVRVPGPKPAGEVVAQHPKAGAQSQSNVVVRLNVSDGSRAASPSTNTNATATPTTVAPTKPTERTASGTPSRPTELVQIPDLEGKKLVDARRLIRKAGLVIEIKRVPNAQPPGIVVAQAKKPGTHVTRGTHLFVTVSMGRPTFTSTTPTQSESQSITVADVTGEDETTATQQLENEGLTVHVVDQETTDASQDGLVVKQTPAANKSVQPQSTVTIYVGRYTNG